MANSFTIDIVCPSLFPLHGGVEKLVWEISTHLVEMDIGVTVFFVGSSQKSSIRRGVRLVQCPSSGPFYLSTNLVSALRSSNSDLIYAHNYGSFAPLAGAISKRGGRPSLVSPQYHGQGSSWRSDMLLKAYRLIGKKMIRCFDLVGYHSEAERKRLVRDFRLSEEVLRYLPPGVNIGSDKKPDRFGEARILYVGRLEQYKNVELLLRAYSGIINTLDTQFGSSDLTIIGEGPDEPRLRSICQDLDIVRRTKFLGGVPWQSLLDLYRRSDVVVVPSSFESFGMVIIEALASGTPVVCSRVGVASELEDRGFLKPVPLPVSSDMLGNSIISSLKHPCMFMEATKFVRKNFSWDSVIDRLLATFSEILGA